MKVLYKQLIFFLKIYLICFAYIQIFFSSFLRSPQRSSLKPVAIGALLEMNCFLGHHVFDIEKLKFYEDFIKTVIFSIFCIPIECFFFFSLLRPSPRSSLKRLEIKAPSKMNCFLGHPLFEIHRSKISNNYNIMKIDFPRAPP